jgi:hypothetical protein
MIQLRPDLAGGHPRVGESELVLPALVATASTGGRDECIHLCGTSTGRHDYNKAPGRPEALLDGREAEVRLVANFDDVVHAVIGVFQAVREIGEEADKPVRSRLQVNGYPDTCVRGLRRGEGHRH